MLKEPEMAAKKEWSIHLHGMLKGYLKAPFIQILSNRRILE